MRASSRQGRRVISIRGSVYSKRAPPCASVARARASYIESSARTSRSVCSSSGARSGKGGRPRGGPGTLQDGFHRADRINVCHATQPSAFCTHPHAAPYDFPDIHRRNISRDRSHHKISIWCHPLRRCRKKHIFRLLPPPPPTLAPVVLI